VRPRHQTPLSSRGKQLRAIARKNMSKLAYIPESFSVQNVVRSHCHQSAFSPQIHATVCISLCVSHYKASLLTIVMVVCYTHS
jgi:hypothetical protein